MWIKNSESVASHPVGNAHRKMVFGFAALVLFLLLLFSRGIYAESTNEKSKAEKSKWTQKMRGMAETLNELLIDLSSDERYNAPKNFKRIENNAKKLTNLAHDIKLKDSGSPDKDPSIRIIGSLFEKESDHAYKALVWGNRAYARQVLKSVSNYCIACHTRNSSGPSFQGFGTNPKLESLKPLEKARYFTSTRQFDRALEDYEQILAEGAKSADRSIEWERAARAALALSVRVKNDPERSLRIVERILSTEKAPFFLRENATKWKESIQKWRDEIARMPQTEEGLYAEALRLISAAKEMQKYPADKSADVLYLRSSRVVHDLLNLNPQGVRSAEALYLAGISYEVLNGLDLWDLHEFYFQACINKAPHSQIARQCFHHYEESIYTSYSGSSGTYLPGEVKDKIEQLDILSGPLNLKTGNPPLQ